MLTKLIRQHYWLVAVLILGQRYDDDDAGITQTHGCQLVLITTIKDQTLKHFLTAATRFCSPSWFIVNLTAAK